MKNKIRKPKGYWTKERCLEEALKYDSRNEFERNCGSAYNSARKNHWLSECYEHMVEIKKYKGFWNRENCEKEAMKYPNKSEFHLKSSRAYVVSLNNNWLEEICSHMTIHYMPDGYWTKEKCLEEALKYENRIDFENNSSSAYSAVYKHNWIDECCGHMKLLHKPKGYWIKEKCLEEALKYNSKSELSFNNSSVYHYIIKNKWQKECFAHMEIMGNRIKRAIYAVIFPDNYVYIGLSYNPENRFKYGHLRIVKKKKSSVYKHFEKTGFFPELKILTDFLDIQTASKQEEVFVKKYKNKGYNVLNKSKTGTLGGNTLRWTKEKCIEEALKYDTQVMFSKKSSGAYNSCIKHNWIKEVCSHMKIIKKPAGYWNDIKNVYSVAKKCDNITEFIKKYRLAYNTLKLPHNISYKNNIYNELGWKLRKYTKKS